MVEVVTVQTRWPDAVAAGEVGTYEQVMLPGFIDEHFLGTEELIAQALRIAPERVLDLGKRKRIALVAMRVVVDFCAFMGAMWLAFYLRFINGYMATRFGPESAPEINAVFLTMLVGFPMLVTFLKASGMYKANARVRTLDKLPKIVIAVNALLVTTTVLLFLLNVQGAFRGYAVFFWFFCILLVFMGRILLQIGLSLAGVADIVERNTLIIGSGQVGKSMALKLKLHPEAGLRPVGFLDDDPLFTQFDEPELKDIRVLGSLDDFAEIAKRYAVEKVIIGFVKGSHEPLLELVTTCNQMGIECSVLPRLFELITHEINVSEIGGISLVPLRTKTISSSKHALKTVEDYALATAGLLIFWPLLLITAVAIKMDSPGPVFYKHTRIGKNGEKFKCLKFRSMGDNAEQLQAKLVEETGSKDWLCWKMTDDPRITRVGKWIRKFSIDEAPQVFNVLAGQMSVVGPRPHIQNEVDQYKNWHYERLNIKPGITGLWQVSGRSNLPFDEMIKLDYYYIEQWSLWEDFKILLRTFSAVLGKKGAY
jgi:exopolysaccharide biosynthesis polyprenyl glycosylphosphotransferase